MGKPSLDNLFAVASEIEALMRFHFANAEKNSSRLRMLLGSVEAWSSSLRSAFGILFNAGCPMFLVWDCNPSQGQLNEHILFYNDAFLSVLQGTEHNLPFGQSVQDSWTEDWSQVRADVEQVFTTGQALRREGEPFLNHQATATGTVPSGHTVQFGMKPIKLGAWWLLLQYALVGKGSRGN